MEIYKNEKYLSVIHNREKNYLRYKWSHMSIPLESLKELFSETGTFVEANGIKVLIADTLKAKSILFPECIDWWGKVEVPKFAGLGVEKIITITSESSLTRMTNERWHGATGSIDLYEVPTLEEAEKII